MRALLTVGIADLNVWNQISARPLRLTRLISTYYKPLQQVQGVKISVA